MGLLLQGPPLLWRCLVCRHHLKKPYLGWQILTSTLWLPKWSSEMWSDFPKITQQSRGRAETHARVSEALSLWTPGGGVVSGKLMLNWGSEKATELREGLQWVREIADQRPVLLFHIVNLCPRTTSLSLSTELPEGRFPYLLLKYQASVFLRPKVAHMLIKAAAAKSSVVSDSVRPHRRQPTRLPHPWDSPGKNTGMGCHFLLQCVKVKSLSRVRLLATAWTAAHQVPPSMGFSRQEYWSRVPLPSPLTIWIWLIVSLDLDAVSILAVKSGGTNVMSHYW